MAAACASEAAGLQGRFWEMHDSLLDDQSHLEDPHLWARAEALGLDLDQFESDRRDDLVIARVKRDFTAGVKGGVVTTPTLVIRRHLVHGRFDPDVAGTARRLDLVGLNGQRSRLAAERP